MNPINRKNSYLGNPKLKKVGVPFNLTEEHLREYIKCKNDPIYFAQNYVKIVTLDRGFINIDLYPFQKETIDDIENNRFVVMKAGRQVGKALDINTPILTTDGWSTMGDLKIGDHIYGTDGKLTQVTFATDIMHDHVCFRVKFDNGETIVADAEHMWTVVVDKKEITTTTKNLVEILEKTKKSSKGISIPISDYIDFENKDESFQIDPYLLGLWLGDGHTDAARITCSIDDYNHYKNKLTPTYKITDFRPDKRSPNVGYFGIYEILPKLKNIGVLGNKCIPENYMRSSLESRLSLIRGLMDSDGYCSKNGICEFDQKNETLIDQVRFVLTSLGIKTRKSSRIINGEIYFKIRCTTDKFKLFSLERKKARQKNIIGNCQVKNIYIESIERTNSVPVRCIQVDAENHLFLCGRTMIPTHNTTTVVAYLLWYILFEEDKFVAILANKAKTAREILNRIKLAYEELPLWLQQGVKGWNKGDIELENNCRILADSTSSSASRGYSINFLYLDEFAFVPNNVAEEFFSSVFPTISSGTTSKILISSTPNGMNHFYKIWKEAEEGVNGFKTIEANWRQVPGRTEEWAAGQKRVLGEQKYLQEMECVGEDTLITVKNKVTGIIEKITIGELYSKIE